MTTRQVNFALWSTAAALSAATAAVLPFAFLRPDRPAAPDDPPESRVAESSGGRASSLPPLSEFQRVWAHPLHRVLAQPVAGPATEPSGSGEQAPLAGDAPPALALVGTIGDSVAMLRTADGSVEAKAAGESVGGAQVVSIRRARVVLRYNGRTVILEKAPEPLTRP